MIRSMSVRSVSLAFVSSVYFAALVANPGFVSAAPSSAATVAVAAYAALSNGDAAKSVSLFTQAIESRELAPESLANAFLNRALAYQTLGKPQNAVDDYSAALNLDAMPSDLRARALYNRGLAQQKLAKPAMAIEDFTSALLVDSSFSHAYLARANALRDSGQYLFSISDYERALKYHHPDPARVYYGEAQAFEALKRPSDTKRLLQAAVAANSQFAPAVEKLKTMGDTAESDDATADPILTGSLATSPSGSTEVMKQALPAAVAPPSALVAATLPAEPPGVDGGDDALATAATDAASGSPAPGMPDMVSTPPPESKVVVASVPKIPAEPVKVASLDTSKPSVNAASGAKSVPAPVVIVSNSPVAHTQDAAPLASGWAVQISSAGSEDSAWATWKTMQKKHKMLESLTPVVVKADLGAKGTFYRVRMQGYADQALAQSACGKLKAAGISCFISKA